MDCVLSSTLRFFNFIYSPVFYGNIFYDEVGMLSDYYGDNNVTNNDFCYELDQYGNFYTRQINLFGDTIFNHTWGQCIECVTGCTDSLAVNFNPNVYWQDNLIGQYIDGCQDPLATNYNPLATRDDGSCDYCWNSLDSTIIINNTPGICDGAIIANINNVSPLNYNNNNYAYHWSTGSTLPLIFDLCEGYYILDFYDGYCTYRDTFQIGFPNQMIFGCTDLTASNYNPLANILDSSCVYCDIVFDTVVTNAITQGQCNGYCLRRCN